MRGAAFALACLLATGVAASEPPRRIISINMCTDQLLLDMVPPDRILGLSPYAGDVLRSWVADKASNLPKLSGSAEEVLILKPDLVLLSRYMKPETLDFIRRRGLPHAEFDDVRSLDEARMQILTFGKRIGEAEAAKTRVDAIDRALADLRRVAAQAGLRVLPLARRGWVAGKETLMSDLLAKAGLSNAAAELGIQDGGFVSLEAIVKLRPDAILVARDDLTSEDQGAAMLLHPAIQGLFPPERRLYLSEKLTVCGGPMLAEAIRQLAAQISTIRKRGSGRSE